MKVMPSTRSKVHCFRQVAVASRFSGRRLPRTWKDRWRHERRTGDGRRCSVWGAVAKSFQSQKRLLVLVYHELRWPTRGKALLVERQGIHLSGT